MDLGNAIKTLRIKLNMTQSQLAEKIGMSITAVSSLETGKAYPPKATVEKLCKAFGISPALFQLSLIDEGDFPEEKRVLYRALLEPLRNELLDPNSHEKIS